MAITLLVACSGGVSTTPPPGTLQSTRYSLGGTVSGLTGSGLVLQSNSGEKLAASDGTFTFQTTLTTGTSYYVVVSAQPGTPTQSCSIANGTGTIGAANVTDVVVSCKDKPPGSLDSIGGVVVGTRGSGLVLQNNGTDNLPVASDGPFVFSVGLPGNSPYSVSVLSPPIDPYQDCLVTNSPGTTGAGNVGDVVISCIVNSNPTHNINVTAQNVTGTITLENNGRDSLKISSAGTYPFSIPIPSGSPYKVTATGLNGTQSEACTLQNGSGVVGDSDIAVVVSCALAVTDGAVTVAVAGLVGSGLVLQDNGGDNLAVAQNGLNTFTTALNAGAAYKVTVLTQPTNPNQACTVSNGTGTAGGNAAAPAVSCTTILYPVSGTVAGLLGADSVILQDNGRDNLTVSANGPFTFLTQLTSGTLYDVTVLTQPLNPGETCGVANATGAASTPGTAPAVNCVPSPVPVAVTVSDLRGSGLVLQDNGGNSLGVIGNGVVGFPAQPYGSAYNVTVLTQPTNLNQTCTVTTAAGSAGITLPAPVVTCVPNPNTISVTVSGLAKGSSLVLQDNGGDNLTVPGNGPFAFATQLLSGTAYNVTVLTQPGRGQTCTVTNATGVAGSSAPAPTVNCVINYAPITGTVTGLQGSGLVLQDNGGDNLLIQGNGQFTFPTRLQVGTTYNVTVLTQPASPAQTCTVANGTGSAGGAGPTPVVTCAFTLSATVNGLNSNEQGSGLVLQNSNGDKVTVALAGPYSVNFPTLLASGTNYSVTVATQPGTDLSGGQLLQTSIVCVVSNGSGTITNSNVSVTVNCVQPIGFAYVTNSLDDTVSTYLVDQSGALLASGGPAVGTGTEPSGAAAIVSNNNGTGFLYVTNKGSNDLSIYAIDPNTGALTAQSANTAGFVSAPATIVNGYSSSTDLYVTGVDPNGSNVYSLTASGASLKSLENPLALAAVPAAGTALIAAHASTFAYMGTSTTYYYLTANPNTNSLYTYQISSNLLTATKPASTTVGPTPTSVAALSFIYPAGTRYATNSYSAVYVANSGDGTITSYILNQFNENLVTQASIEPAATIGQGNVLQLAQTASFVLATDSTQLYAYQAQSDGLSTASLKEVTGSRPFPGGATPGPLATFYVYPNVTGVAVSAVAVSAASAVYAVDVSGATIHVFTVTPKIGLTPVLQQGKPATATTGKAPSAIVLSLRPAFSF